MTAAEYRRLRPLSAFPAQLRSAGSAGRSLAVLLPVSGWCDDPAAGYLHMEARQAMVDARDAPRGLMSIRS